MTSELDLHTPYYLIDENKLLKNLEKISLLRDLSGAKSVLALKCFSTWSVFDLMNQYMDGTTSSSLYEAKLGKEKFGKEVHAYSVAWSDSDVNEIAQIATKVIFNSISQLDRYYEKLKHLPLGIRLNPGVSFSDFDLANPARKHSRLGLPPGTDLSILKGKVSGAMFHCNCENNSLPAFKNILQHISKNYSDFLKTLEWVSLGGGIYFTQENYPLKEFAKELKDFANQFDIQVYLEPGETAITNSGYLVTEVLDLIQNEIEIAIVDSAVETHMLDLLIYSTPAKMELPQNGKHQYQVTGKTCLAGDIFGTYNFPEPLKIGDRIRFSDASGYTIVKKNWFNGVNMPSIVIKRLNGNLDLVREFHYNDFLNNLSMEVE